jgi:pimeloyl-ACP methyl ester carboxylesterase
MKTRTGSSPARYPLYALLTLMISLALLSGGCSKDTSDPVPANTWLVSAEKVKSYNVAFIKYMLTGMNNSFPGIDSLSGEVKHDIDVYRITYNTTWRGSSKLASGLVCVPTDEGSYPLISFQNGTNTLGSNAPSVNPSDPLYTLIQSMASHGFVVAIPDYLGFGASATMLHPYYDKVSTTQSVADMIQASLELLNDTKIKAKSNGKTLLMGYSQGGWATLATLKQLEDKYAGKIDVQAASCGAGAYDINAMSADVLSQTYYPSPVYLPYFIYSKIIAGDILNPLTVFFKEPYAERIPRLFNGSFSNGDVNAELTDTIASLVTDALRTEWQTASTFSSLREAMTTNSVQAWNAGALLRFYHGTADDNISPQQSAGIYEHFLSAGVSSSRVTLIPIPGADHSTGLIPWGVSTMLWFDTFR